MTCLHERIKSVNCEKSCLICGAKLPADFIPGKATKADEKPAEGETKKATRKKVK